MRHTLILEGRASIRGGARWRVEMNTANLLWGLLFGSIGVGFLIYARRERAPVPLVAGLALSIYPFFINNTLWLVLIGVALTAAPYFIRL